MKTGTRKAVLLRLLNTYTIIGITLIILATILFLTPALPYLWYHLNPNASEQEANNLSSPEPQDDNAQTEEPQEPELPPFDPTLPSTNTLIINSIGVNGAINESTNARVGLEEGIWRAPDWGTPELSYATILAAHRFGYIYWTNDFRRTQSFYNLPETKVGDTVQVIWNQRQYEYEIYRAEDSTELLDYNADLVLYTCRMFNSPVRVFRYAERTN